MTFQLIVSTCYDGGFISTKIAVRLPPANYEAACIFHDLRQCEDESWSANAIVMCDKKKATQYHNRLIAAIEVVDAEGLTPVHAVSALLASPKLIALFDQPFAVRDATGRLGIVDLSELGRDASDFFDTRLDEHFGWEQKHPKELNERVSIRLSWPRA